MLQLIPLILQLLEMGITIAPEMIAAAKMEYRLLTGDRLSSEELAAIRAQTVAAHAAVQAA